MNFVTQTLHQLHRTRRGLVVALVGVGAVVPMLAAAPAFADHQVQVSVTNGGFSFGLQSAPNVKCVPIDSWANREFERGQCAGRDDGSREGFCDGLRNCFDLRIRLDLCRSSRPFEDGYRSTYKHTYSEAFSKGNCERMARIERERCERERLVRLERERWERERQCHIEWNHGRGWGPPWRQ